MKYKIINSELINSYRYILEVETEIESQKRLVVIQINPSVANGSRSDPTVGKVSHWACDKEYGHISFLNLFAFISANPTTVSNMPYSELVGSLNDSIIKDTCKADDSIIVLAWGKPSGIFSRFYEKRVAELKRLIEPCAIHHVGNLSHGIYPRHGRMWNKEHRELTKLNWKQLIS